MMKKVILCPNPHRDRDLRAAQEAKRILDELHCNSLICLPFYSDTPDTALSDGVHSLQQELRGADLVIAFGGDGTMLHLAKTVAQRNVPLLGVNLGSLGFMTELEQTELIRLHDLVSGRYAVENRMMLDVSILREGRTIYTNLALNEVVITRGNISRVVRLRVDTESGKLMDITGDGVIVASPTGSTAYSLSAGGPVVEPTARMFIVSPICAHSVHANAYILGCEHTITVRSAKDSYKPLLMSVDGGKIFSLRNGDVVEIKKSRYETKLLRLSHKSFCSILHKKMRMGGIEDEE